MLWRCAYIGLGSNLDDPVRQVQGAFDALASLDRTLLLARSSLYGSRPWGVREQPDFVNAVAGLLTRLSAEELFQRLKALEQQLGRVLPVPRYGPRRIDLDLLVYDQLRVQTPELQLPHPGVVSRNFVLYPLCEIAPDLPIPGAGHVSELLARVDRDGLWRLDSQPL